MNDEWILAYVTTENPEQAEHIGKTLILEGLAGCINILPGMKSLYLWQGNLESAQETVLLVKTHLSRRHEIEKRIVALHTYETPCILFLPIHDGLSKYLKWLGDACKPT
jgi:periplasmic divalent cation tolerance protein